MTLPKLERISTRIWRLGQKEFSLRTILRANFVLSVIGTIITGALLVANGWPHGRPPGPYKGRYAPGAGDVEFGLILVVIESLLWWRQFNEDTNDNARNAGIMGSLLILPPLELVIAKAPSDIPLSLPFMIVPLTYLGLSHLAYGLYCWNAGRRTLGE